MPALDSIITAKQTPSNRKMAAAASEDTHGQQNVRFYAIKRSPLFFCRIYEISHKLFILEGQILTSALTSC